MNDEMEGLASIKGQLQRETSRVRGRASGKVGPVDFPHQEKRPNHNHKKTNNINNNKDDTLVSSVVMMNETTSLQEIAKRLQEEKSRVTTRRNNKRQIVAIDAFYHDTIPNTEETATTEMSNEISKMNNNEIYILATTTTTTAAATSAYNNQVPEESDEGKTTKTVRFSILEQREYPVCLGDNPAGGWGVPISLEWDHISEVTVTIDDYENDRPPSRDRVELRLPADTRWEMLLDAGYGKREMKFTLQRMNRTRFRRMRTMDTLAFQVIEECFETLGRAIRNVTTRRVMKREEREFVQYWNKVHQQQLLLIVD